MRHIVGGAASSVWRSLFWGRVTIHIGTYMRRVEHAKCSLPWPWTSFFFRIPSFGRFVCWIALFLFSHPATLLLLFPFCVSCRAGRTFGAFGFVFAVERMSMRQSMLQDARFNCPTQGSLGYFLPCIIIEVFFSSWPWSSIVPGCIGTWISVWVLTGVIGPEILSLEIGVELEI